MLGAAVAGIALKEAIPLGRVWSFPSKIVIPPPGNLFLNVDWITKEHLRMLEKNMTLASFCYYPEFAAPEHQTFKFPQRCVIHTLLETDLLTGSVSHQS